MLKDWCYENNTDPLESESDVGNTDLDNVTEEVVVNLTKKIAGKQKSTRPRRSEKNSQVLHFIIYY